MLLVVPEFVWSLLLSHLWSQGRWECSLELFSLLDVCHPFQPSTTMICTSVRIVLRTEWLWCRQGGYSYKGTQLLVGEPPIFCQILSWRHEAYLLMLECFARSDYLVRDVKLFSKRIRFLATSVTTVKNVRQLDCPLIKMIDSGTLCSLIVSLWYFPVFFSILFVALVGGKCVGLV